MTRLLKENDTVAFFAASNALSNLSKDNINSLKELLNNMGLNVIYGNNLFATENSNPFNSSAKEKASKLNELFSSKDIKAIFDLSGGDISNSILDFLDFETIKNNPKPFFGYSDLSPVLNAINKKCGFPTFHYQLKHLVLGEHKEQQIKLFKECIMGESNELFKFDYEFIKGKSMRGVVVGGNIRCTLKTAGTNFEPSFSNKILFLESYSGNAAKIYTMLYQYKQMGAFDDLKGIILGKFTEMELNNIKPTVSEILIDILSENNNIPIVKTDKLGHGSDAKCIVIGGACNLT